MPEHHLGGNRLRLCMTVLELLGPWPWPWRTSVPIAAEGCGHMCYVAFLPLYLGVICTVLFSQLSH